MSTGDPPGNAAGEAQVDAPPEERAVVVAALARVLAGTATERAVTEGLRALPHLDDAGRGRVARRITAASIQRLFVAHALGVPSTLVTAAELFEGYTRFVEQRAPVLHAYPADVRARMACEQSCPRPLVDALVDSLGEDGARAFLTVSNAPGPRTLRANTLRCTREALAARLRTEGIDTRAGPLSPWALHVEGRANLFGSEAWRDGWFEVQDEGSQCAALTCGARTLAGATVVDLCAGRGGKTLALAAMMQNEGSLYVHDIDERALADMRPRLARAGVTCVRAGLPPAGARVDVVLVDAPCSSTGVLRRSPDLRFTFDPRALEELTRTQRALVERARALSDHVVYATCSVLRAENHEIADACGLARQRVLLPHVDGCDGFFIAHCFSPE